MFYFGTATNFVLCNVWTFEPSIKKRHRDKNWQGENNQESSIIGIEKVIYSNVMSSFKSDSNDIKVSTHLKLTFQIHPSAQLPLLFSLPAFLLVQIARFELHLFLL